MILYCNRRKVLDAHVRGSFRKRDTTLCLSVTKSIFITRRSFCMQDVIQAIGGAEWAGPD